MMKKTKLIAGVALLVQAVTFFILFCVLWAKKKSVAGAFLAVSALGGATGAFLLYQVKKEISKGSVEFDDDVDPDALASHPELEDILDDDEEELEIG